MRVKRRFVLKDGREISIEEDIYVRYDQTVRDVLGHLVRFRNRTFQWQFIDDSKTPQELLYTEMTPDKLDWMGNPRIDEYIGYREPLCDCGGPKTGGWHSFWCSTQKDPWA